MTTGTLQFDFNSIPGLLHHKAQQYPAMPAYHFPETGQTCTWSGLWAEVQAVAAGLRRLGVRRHDRVAILMEGCPELVVCLYATITAGAVAVPLSTYLTKEELHYHLQQAR